MVSDAPASAVSMLYCSESDMVAREVLMNERWNNAAFWLGRETQKRGDRRARSFHGGKKSRWRERRRPDSFKGPFTYFLLQYLRRDMYFPRHAARRPTHTLLAHHGEERQRCLERSESTHSKTQNSTHDVCYHTHHLAICSSECIATINTVMY
jgi:hypothetical protein